MTVLPGVRGREDLKRILGFLDASPEEKDYSVLGTFAPQEQKESVSTAITASHVLPGWTWGLINKYYDLAQAGDVAAKDHYMNLEKTASDCIAADTAIRDVRSMWSR